MTAARIEDDTPRGFMPMAEYLRLQRRCDDLEERLAFALRHAKHRFADERINHVRAELKLSCQQAKLLLALYFANGRRATSRWLHRACGARDEGSKHQVSVVAFRVNAACMKLGSPRVMAGTTGANGMYTISDEAAAWLRRRLPEIFEKGAST